MRLSSVADRNVLIVSFGFFFVFSGYNATQRFATSADEYNGAISLGVLYIVFLLTNFIAAPIFKTFSPKITLVLSTISYILFIASNIEYNVIFLYVTAVCVGLSAPMLWIAKERLITESSNHYELTNNLSLYSHIGYYNGIFWIIYLFHQTLGSLFGAIVLDIGYSIHVMYAVFTTLTVLGTITLMFVQNTKQENIKHSIEQTMNENNKNEMRNDVYKISKVENDDDNKSQIEMMEDNKVKKKYDETQKLMLMDNTLIDIYGTENKWYWIRNEIKQSIISVISLWKQWNFQCVFIFTSYTGTFEAYVAADFPLLMIDDKLKLYMLAYFGFISAVFALIFGKLADKITQIPIIAMVFVLHLFYWIFLYIFIDEIVDKQSVITLIILSTILALGYSGCTQIVAIYPILLGKESCVWQNFHIFRVLPVSLVFIMHNFVTIKTKIISYGIILILGCIPLLLFPSIRKEFQKVRKQNNSPLKS